MTYEEYLLEHGNDEDREPRALGDTYDSGKVCCHCGEEIMPGDVYLFGKLWFSETRDTEYAIIHKGCLMDYIQDNFSEEQLIEMLDLSEEVER